jgi:alpha-tubulin suppressor-like RCC1 family protein
VKRRARRSLSIALAASLIALTSIGFVPLAAQAAPVPNQATQIAGGAAHTCALTLAAGSVKCWGDNRMGQLGNGTNTDSDTPVSVSGLTGVTQITAGDYHTCALITDGSVRCWGARLGKGIAISSNTPAPVSGLTGVIQVSAGDYHSCAVLAGGTAKCWGANYYGQLGNGTNISSWRPVSVAGLTGVTEISAGRYHTFALVSGGSVKCWGWNPAGQLCNGTNASSKTSVSVSGLTGVTMVSSGDFHACAVRSGGAAKCWGANGDGQLGNGTSTDSKRPVSVSGLTGVAQISAGARDTCALIADGSVRCWGFNSWGQLGNGTTADSYRPVSVSGLTGATQVSAGYLHTCALIADGSVKCWGATGKANSGTAPTLAPACRSASPDCEPGRLLVVPTARRNRGRLCPVGLTVGPLGFEPRTCGLGDHRGSSASVRTCPSSQLGRGVDSVAVRSRPHRSTRLAVRLAVRYLSHSLLISRRNGWAVHVTDRPSCRLAANLATLENLASHADITSCVALEPVVPGPAVELVVSAVALDDVVARSTTDQVVAVIAFERVVATQPDDDVSARPSFQDVVSRRSDDRRRMPEALGRRVCSRRRDHEPHPDDQNHRQRWYEPPVLVLCHDSLLLVRFPSVQTVGPVRVSRYSPGLRLGRGRSRIHPGRSIRPPSPAPAVQRARR